MVSGFLTSPCDQRRMSSAVARPMRSSSKVVTSSNFPSLLEKVFRQLGLGRLLDLVDRRRFEAGGNVDAELFGGTERFVVRVAQADRRAVCREHLDVQAERLHFL